MLTWSRICVTRSGQRESRSYHLPREPCVRVRTRLLTYDILNFKPYEELAKLCFFTLKTTTYSVFQRNGTTSCSVLQVPPIIFLF